MRHSARLDVCTLARDVTGYIAACFEGVALALEHAEPPARPRAVALSFAAARTARELAICVERTADYTRAELGHRPHVGAGTRSDAAWHVEACANVAGQLHTLDVLRETLLKHDDFDELPPTAWGLLDAVHYLLQNWSDSFAQMASDHVGDIEELLRDETAAEQNAAAA